MDVRSGNALIATMSKAVTLALYSYRPYSYSYGTEPLTEQHCCTADDAATVLVREL